MQVSPLGTSIVSTIPSVPTSAQPAATATATSAAAAATAPLFHIAQFNVENFFDPQVSNAKDHAPTAQQYQIKLTKLADAISGNLGAPDVVSLCEVGGQQELNDLLSQPQLAKFGYRSVIMPTNDNRGINVAMLYRPDVTIDHVSDPNPVSHLHDYPGDEVDGTKLFARQPLDVQLTWNPGAAAAAGAVRPTGGQPIDVILNHMKSKLGGPALDARRGAQGAYVGSMVDKQVAAHPSTPVIVLGDFNANPGDPAYTQLMQGNRLVDTSLAIPQSDRFTYRYGKELDDIDHIFVSPNMASTLVSTDIPHIDTAKTDPKQASDPTVVNGVSDHDPLQATFDFSKLAAPTARD